MRLAGRAELFSVCTPRGAARAPPEKKRVARQQRPLQRNNRLILAAHIKKIILQDHSFRNFLSVLKSGDHAMNGSFALPESASRSSTGAGCNGQVRIEAIVMDLKVRRQGDSEGIVRSSRFLTARRAPMQDRRQ